MTDEEITKQATKLNQNLKPGNIQTTLVKINDMIDDDYLLASDTLFDIFDSHDVHSYSEAVEAYNEDCDPANGADVVKEDKQALRWLNNNDSYDFVDWIKPGKVTLKQAHGIMNDIIRNAKDYAF